MVMCHSEKQTEFKESEDFSAILTEITSAISSCQESALLGLKYLCFAKTSQNCPLDLLKDRIYYANSDVVRSKVQLPVRPFQVEVVAGNMSATHSRPNMAAHHPRPNVSQPAAIATHEPTNLASHFSQEASSYSQAKPKKPLANFGYNE